MWLDNWLISVDYEADVQNFLTKLFRGVQILAKQM